MKLTCIICPRGCSMETDGVTVSGNGCPRGREYALSECLHPVRTVTAVVPVADRPGEYLSVKTAAPIPKDKIFALMDLIHQKNATTPIRIGDIMIKDVFGTDVVATKNIE